MSGRSDGQGSGGLREAGLSPAPHVSWSASMDDKSKPTVHRRLQPVNLVFSSTLLFTHLAWHTATSSQTGFRRLCTVSSDSPPWNQRVTRAVRQCVLDQGPRSSRVRSGFTHMWSATPNVPHQVAKSHTPCNEKSVTMHNVSLHTREDLGPRQQTWVSQERMDSRE